MPALALTVDDAPDPWRCTTSDHEQAKCAATLAACGEGPFAGALELGGPTGVLGALLAPRCERLDTLDLASAAVGAARARRAAHHGSCARRSATPQDVPAGPFDLVVASEVLCSLEEEALLRTLTRIEQVLVPGGRLVAVHWRPPGADRPHAAETVHRLLRCCAWLRPVRMSRRRTYLLDAFDRR